MPYTLLSKLFYENKSEYEEKYKARYESEYTVRLHFDINGNPAFFVQTPAIYRMLADILRMNKAVSDLCDALPPAATEQFFRRCLTDEIVLTNNIEGVNSTRKEILEILDELEEKSKGKRFYGLVNKYLLIAIKELPIATCQDVRNIYDELVLQEVKEEEPENIPDGKLFRKNSVSVYSPSQKEIHKGVYPEEKIMEAMENALTFLHDDSCEVLFRIAIFHYLLEYIHPFYDGNGRLGRFICSYLLSQELEPITGYRLSYTIKENISEYYKAFVTCNNPLNKGDLTSFLEMFLNIIKISVEKLKESLQEGLIRLSRGFQLIPYLNPDGDTDLNEIYSLLIQAALFSEFGVNTDVVLEHVGISRTTLNRKIKKIPANLLVKEKHGRENYYSLDINALEQMGDLQ